ncbi:MAG: BamA/TamA family outer membrane protein [Ignavibacteriales bacterium]|nr:BamA/TamA family outer membrane protein [Ignavibacteriales bacterium]
MIRHLTVVLAFLWTGLTPLGPVLSQSLKVVTMNVWSGLDYRGTFSMGVYEPDSVREQRYRSLATELRRTQADVILLQECNPVNTLGSFFARELGYDWIRTRVNAGIKIGRLGLPVNLNEGLVILARKDLDLEFVDVWKLSEGFGAPGNVISFHFTEQNVALVGRIKIGASSFIVINLHIPSDVPDDSASRQYLEDLVRTRNFSPAERTRAFKKLSDGARNRLGQVNRLLALVESHFHDTPLILGGDFNATEHSEEIRLLAEQFVHAVPAGDVMTWDPSNPNTAYSRRLPEDPDVLDELDVWYDGVPRFIDHVFFGGGFRASDVQSVSVVVNKPTGGLYPSDHYGLLAEVSLDSIMRIDRAASGPARSLEVLPILSYDTDVGFGYGAKGFLLSPFGYSESVDITVFNSTKGERWYRFVFSVPDFEVRQGTTYPVSLDVVADYDRYLKNNFYGLGSGTRAENHETYTKEPLEIQLVAGRGWSRKLVTQVGLKFKTVNNVGYVSSGLFAGTLDSINHGRSSGWSLTASVRYDSRDSYINPSRGYVAQLDAERGFAGDYRATSASLALQTYEALFYPKTILAVRVMGQIVDGTGLPVHTYASLGGNRTLRGFPQDRFLGKALVLGNLEARFPIVWRFQGLVYYDAGQVHENAHKLIRGRGWRTDIGTGLRFLMDTFVVRLDVGWSDEGSGLYFNFGHVF